MPETNQDQPVRTVEEKTQPVKLYLKRTSTGAPQDRPDGTQFVNLSVGARQLDNGCTRLTFIDDPDVVEAFVEDLESITKRSVEVECHVVYVEKTYVDDDGETRKVVHANGRLADVGCAIDDVLDAIDDAKAAA